MSSDGETLSGRHGAGFHISEDNSNPCIEHPFGLLRVDEQGGENHECFKHGSDVEDGLIVVLCGKDRCQLVADDGGEVHHRHVARELRPTHFGPGDPHHQRIRTDGDDGPEEGVNNPHHHHEPTFAPHGIKHAPS
jgi:hypothetical protein